MTKRTGIFAAALATALAAAMPITAGRTGAAHTGRRASENRTGATCSSCGPPARLASGASAMRMAPPRQAPATRITPQHQDANAASRRGKGRNARLPRKFGFHSGPSRQSNGRLRRSIAPCSSVSCARSVHCGSSVCSRPCKQSRTYRYNQPAGATATQTRYTSTASVPSAPCGSARIVNCAAFPHRSGHRGVSKFSNAHQAACAYAGNKSVQPNVLQAQPNARTFRANRRDGTARVTQDAARQGRFASRFAQRAGGVNARDRFRACGRASCLAARPCVQASLPWYGPVFWPYAYSDIFDYAFWPYGYDDGYWAYAYDDFFDGVFWGEVGPPQDYAYAAPSTAPSAPRPSYAGVQELCKQPGSGITAWPFADIERNVGLNTDQKQLAWRCTQGEPGCRRSVQSVMSARKCVPTHASRPPGLQ